MRISHQPILALALISIATAAVAQEAKPKPKPKPKPAITNQVSFGLGGGIGGKYGGRRGGRRRLSRGGTEIARAIERGLEWLKANQKPDGSFVAGGDTPSVNANVIATSLALHAFLADGSSMRSGPYKAQVKSAVRWLRAQQKPSGAFGDEASADFAHTQAVATLAMAETQLLSMYKTLLENSQTGFDRLASFRVVRGGFSPDPRVKGKPRQVDPMLTLWCTLAYVTAEDARLRPVLALEETAADGLRETGAWLRRAIDPKTGKIRKFPGTRGPLGSDALETDPVVREREWPATVLFCAYLAGENPRSTEGGRKALAALAASEPKWKKGAMSHYEWYCASHALFQAGGKEWRKWSKAMVEVATANQRADGSWDPDDVWGAVGGRVYSTAMLTLTLSSYFHYGRLVR